MIALLAFLLIVNVVLSVYLVIKLWRVHEEVKALHDSLWTVSDLLKKDIWAGKPPVMLTLGERDEK